MNEKINGVWVLRSSEPLPNELAGLKKVYIVLAVIWLIGYITDATFFLTIGGCGLGLWFIFNCMWSYAKVVGLRNEKFKFTSGVSSAEIFDKLQSRLISRYGSSMQIERRTVSSENNVCVRYGNFTYDIFLNGDSTFTIRWEKSTGGLFAPFDSYSNYKKVTSAMAMIGYELQQAFGIVYSANDNSQNYSSTGEREPISLSKSSYENNGNNLWICKNCGYSNSADGDYCVKCGHKKEQ